MSKTNWRLAVIIGGILFLLLWGIWTLNAGCASSSSGVIPASTSTTSSSTSIASSSSSTSTTLPVLSGWQQLGDQFAGEGLSFCLDGGVPYLAYMNGTNFGKAAVRKYEAGKWKLVGIDGFSYGSPAGMALAFDNGVPYVAFPDGGMVGSEWKMRVMSLVGGASWLDVGTPPLSSGIANNPSIRIVGGVPYIAYQDISFPGSVVKSFIAANWQDLGGITKISSGDSGYTKMVDCDGSLYLAEMDSIDTLGILRMYTGSAWQNLGTFTSPFPGALTLFVTDEAGNPAAYSAFVSNVSTKISAAKYALSAWSGIGTGDFTDSGVNALSLFVYDKTPYVAYTFDPFSYKLVVMKYVPGQDWVKIGTAPYITDEAQNPMLYVDTTGIFLAYTDKHMLLNKQVTVLKYPGL